MGAVQFARAEYVSRGKGGSATRSAAYAAREYVKDERLGVTHDFTHRAPAAHVEVLLPPGASPGLSSVAGLSNAMELSEKRKDSQTAREFVLALPASHEVSHGDRVEMLRSFVHDQFVSKGLGAIVAIHQPEPKKPGETVDLTSESANWHAHIIVSTRRVNSQGLEDRKARDLDPEVRRAGGKSFVTEADRWGEIWREHQNAYFRSHGMVVRVDPPAIHTGPHVGPVRFRGPAGKETEADAEKLAARNAEAVRDPAKVIAALTGRNATFTAREVERVLTKAGIEGKELRTLKAEALALPGVVKLFDSEGQAVGRFTTKAVRQHELAVMQDAGEVARSRHPSLNVEPGSSLRPDQARAFTYAVSEGGVKVIEGRAGTGKSYTLGAIRDAYEIRRLRGSGARAPEQGRPGIEARRLQTFRHADQRVLGFETRAGQVGSPHRSDRGRGRHGGQRAHGDASG